MANPTLTTLLSVNPILMECTSFCNISWLPISTATFLGGPSLTPRPGNRHRCQNVSGDWKSVIPFPLLIFLTPWQSKCRCDILALWLILALLVKMQTYIIGLTSRAMYGVRACLRRWERGTGWKRKYFTLCCPQFCRAATETQRLPDPAVPRWDWIGSSTLSTMLFVNRKLTFVIEDAIKMSLVVNCIWQNKSPQNCMCPINASCISAWTGLLVTVQALGGIYVLHCWG